MSKNLAAVIASKSARLTIQERAIPTPGPKQVVVHNHSVAINPVDHKIQQAGVYVQQYPFVLGLDLAGTIHEIGNDVSYLKKGDRVTGYGAGLFYNDPDMGAQQTYTLMNEFTVSKIPDWMGFEEASIVTQAFTTAAVGLTIDLGLPQVKENKDLKGVNILIWGGSASVGGYAIQIAKQLGLTVYTTASPSNNAFVKSLGADYVFNHRDADVASEIATEIGEAGLPYVYDAVGSAASQEGANGVIDKVGKHTKVVTTQEWKESPRSANIDSVGKTLGSKFLAVKDGELAYQWFHEWLPKALETKAVKPVPEVQIVEGGLESIQLAYDALKKGVSAKKLVINV